MEPEIGEVQEHPWLKIEHLPTGQIKVTGCIGNEMLCDWMMKKARQAIEKHCEQQSNLITPAHMAGFPSGNGR